jgi:hypothetical protein
MLDKEKTISRIAPFSLTQIKNVAPPPVPLPTGLTVRCRSGLAVYASDGVPRWCGNRAGSRSRYRYMIAVKALIDVTRRAV